MWNKTTYSHKNAKNVTIWVKRIYWNFINKNINGLNQFLTLPLEYNIMQTSRRF